MAVAEAAFVSGVGAELDLSSNGSFPEAILFGEEASRVVISCDPKNREHIQQVTVKWGIRTDRIGRTVPDNLTIRIDGYRAISASVSELKEEWETALPRALHAETPEHLVPEILQKS